MSVIRDETIHIEQPIRSVPDILDSLNLLVLILFFATIFAMLCGTMSIHHRIDHLEKLLTGEQAAESIFSSQPTHNLTAQQPPISVDK